MLANMTLLFVKVTMPSFLPAVLDNKVQDLVFSAGCSSVLWTSLWSSHSCFYTPCMKLSACYLFSSGSLRKDALAILGNMAMFQIGLIVSGLDISVLPIYSVSDNLHL